MFPPFALPGAHSEKICQLLLASNDAIVTLFMGILTKLVTFGRKHLYQFRTLKVIEVDCHFTTMRVYAKSAGFGNLTRKIRSCTGLKVSANLEYESVW